MRPRATDSQESPPFFQSWNSVYVLVVGVLVAVGILFYIFTRHFE